jgi:hypothetical protein
MPEVNEKEVCDALLKYKGSGKMHIENAEISLSLDPVDIHSVDSPDCLLWIYISLKLFGQDLKLRIPIPVEAEKGGIFGGALEDLRKFVERGRYPMELPMLVVAEAGYDTNEQIVSFPVRFVISQLPIRHLKDQK